MYSLTLRARSTKVSRRAGLSLMPIGQWTQHTLDDIDQLQTAHTLLALVDDPGITVELGGPQGADEFVWHPAPSAEDLRQAIAQLEVAQADLTGAWMRDLVVDGQVINTSLPSVERTLEDGTDTYLPPLPGAGDTDTTEHTEGSAEGVNQAAAEGLPLQGGPQNADTATPAIPSQPGEALGQVQETTSDPVSSPAPAAPSQPAGTETATKPKAKARK